MTQTMDTQNAQKEHKPVLQIYDTTLREGMQTPGGIGGNPLERIYAANLISRYADYVEIGMPANEVDFKDIANIKDSFVKNNREAGIAVLCRLKEFEIDRAEKSVSGYHTTLAHLFIGTSEEHRSVRFKGEKTKDEYASDIERMVAYAASKPFTRIMFSPEDSYRTFHASRDDFFFFVDAAIRGYEKGSAKIGRKERLVLNFPDTVGYSTISEFDSMLDAVLERYGENIEISLHGHNDSGASLQQAVEACMKEKASWLQTTFGGLGERNGIASTEGVIAILNERGRLAGKRYSKHGVLRQLVPAAHAILAALGRTVPDEAVVSGYNTRVSTAGIHTALAIADEKTYHINGDKYGAPPVIEFGPTSGANQIIPILHKLGIMKEKNDEDVAKFTDMLKSRCNEGKRSLTETDIEYEAIHHFGDISDPLSISGYFVTIRKGSPPVFYMDGAFDGKKFSRSFTASGTVETILLAFDRIVNEGIEKTLRLVRFDPKVRPKIPAEYLAWDAGQEPRIPGGTDVHSDFAVTTGIRNNSNGNGSNGGASKNYFGFATGEDTFTTIVESVMDAVIKMTAIQKWYLRRAVQK